MLALTRYSSLGGMVAARRRAGRGRLFGRFDLAILFAGFALLVLWKHRANIGRLVARRRAEGRAERRPEMPAPADQIARLRLIRSDNIGPVTYFQLLARFGSAQAAIDAIPDLAARGGGRAPRLASRAEIEREIETVERLGARHLFLGQGLYPPLLAELETAPPALIVKGDLDAARQAGGRDGRRAQRLGRRLPLRPPARPGAGRGRDGRRLRAWRAASIRPRMTARSTPARSR